MMNIGETVTATEENPVPVLSEEDTDAPDVVE